MGTRIIFNAATNGDLQGVRKLLDEGSFDGLDLNLQQNGMTALMWASQKGHLEVARLFLEHGAQVDLQDYNGYTALMEAARSGQASLVALLLEHGAQVDVLTKNGETALMIAWKKGRIEVVLQLLDCGAKIGDTALAVASQKGDSSMVDLLLPRGAHMDFQEQETAALLMATRKGHTSVLEQFLKHRPGLLDWLVQCLALDDNPKQQQEAAWVLTNISSVSENHTLSIVNAGAVPALIRLLSSPDEDVQQQAAWTLGNISGDNVAFRDLVLSLGAVPAMLRMCETLPSRVTTRTIAWVLANLCRGPPYPDVDIVRPMIPTLAQLLMLRDPEILSESCSALARICDGSDAGKQALLDGGAASRLVPLLYSMVDDCQRAVFHMVASFAKLRSHHIEVLIDLELLYALHEILSSSTAHDLRRHICSTIANITAMSMDLIQHVVNSDVLVRMLLVFSTSEEDTQKEIFRSLSNVAINGSVDHVWYLIDKNALPILKGGLAIEDVEIVAVVLQAVIRILNTMKTDRV